MGSSTSKATKVYPKTVQRPAWAGARTGQAPQGVKASESKSAEIEKDAQDPQLLANLTKLGAVRVNHQHVQPVKPSPNNVVVNSRIRIEESDTRGISAQNLSELFNAAKASSQLDPLIKKYGLDIDTFRNLSKYINTPSVNSASIVKTKDKDGRETDIATAIWIESKA